MNRAKGIVLFALIAASSPSCREDVKLPPSPGLEDAGGGGTGGADSGGDGSGGQRDAPKDVGPDTTAMMDVAKDVESPKDVAADLPADVPPPNCGGAGQACCAGNGCRDGGCCYAGRCVANTTSCRADLTCINGSCGGCGGIGSDGKGQPCCDTRMCTASATVCAGAGGGTCQACGGNGQPCCGGSYCDPGHVCDAKQMAPLGACVAIVRSGIVPPPAPNTP